MTDAEVNGREDEARRLRNEIDRLGVHNDELQALVRRFTDSETRLDQLRVRIWQLELKYGRIEANLNPITLLPDYTFSPRDLFIAFVTRSIHQTGSLDIICRHWAPELTSIKDGADGVP